jgi:DNA segregation ATPase FtsK/SpoIIIE, S-DNA-T family
MKSKLRIALGQDTIGQPICADLASMPHLLLTGTTGSGKSVCVNSIIAGLLCTATPADVRFLMIDTKRVELVNFNGIPHLIQPVVVEIDHALAALQNTVKEMNRRFKLFAQKGARNIESYNHMIAMPDEARLPFLLVIVDEPADLVAMSPDQFERTITQIAQSARPVGIHLILVTQRPTVDVLAGLIKANFPARISFRVMSQLDSRVVLNSSGAEKLFGRGDMLYMSSDTSKLVRLQGCYVSDRELDKLVTYWKACTLPAKNGALTATGNSTRVDQLLSPPVGDKEPLQAKTMPGEEDLMPQAIELVKQSHRVSVSLLQRRLRIGYSRAARLMELLEENGIVGPDEGPSKGRVILVKDDAHT